MQPKSNSPSDIRANPNSGKFLIPPSQRRKFFLQFTLMTILGWVVGGITTMGLENSTLGNLLPVDSFHRVKILGNIVFAVVFAADQALVLHRYISGLLWMLATSTGWLVVNSVGIPRVKHISSVVISFHQGESPDLAFMGGLLSTVLYILAVIWLGLCQWLVLRRYAKQLWWWNFLPFLSFTFISIFLCFLSLVKDLIPEVSRTPILYWSEQGFTAIILAIVPAIGLCTLKTNSHPPTKNSSSPYHTNS
ncbi:hypothetical protein [Umezakia ovalisporum]|uniref:hypothetical protein n=1 Tax=Umezakia ovalisporum TaxID=75695 RepID=UPI0035B7A9D8